jgi:zinc-ribbon domain
MAFCNSCGTNLQAGARFCPKCGAAIPLAGAISPPVSSAPAASQANSALKIILIVVGVIVALGILGIGTMMFVVHHIAHNRHTEDKNGNVRVDTPFGTVQTTNNSDEAAHNLGVDLYPGARVVQGNSATIGGMHTVQAEFESDDSADKVMAFYAARFPNANVTKKNHNHYSIVSTDKNNLVTITIEPGDGKTRIKIATVSGKNVTGSSSSD